MTSQPNTAFLLKRAEEEAIRAIAALQPEAALAHQELSKHYSVKALDALAESRDGGSTQSAGEPHIQVLAS